MTPDASPGGLAAWGQARDPPLGRAQVHSAPDPRRCASGLPLPESSPLSAGLRFLLAGIPDPNRGSMRFLVRLQPTPTPYGLAAPSPSGSRVRRNDVWGGATLCESLPSPASFEGRPRGGGRPGRGGVRAARSVRRGRGVLGPASTPQRRPRPPRLPPAPCRPGLDLAPHHVVRPRSRGCRTPARPPPSPSAGRTGLRPAGRCTTAPGRHLGGRRGSTRRGPGGPSPSPERPPRWPCRGAASWCRRRRPTRGSRRGGPPAAPSW